MRSGDQKIEAVSSERQVLGLPVFDFFLLMAFVAAIVFSALMVSFVSQKNRHHFNELELLRKDNVALHSRLTRWLLGRSTLSSSVRSETLATKLLQLRAAKPSDTVIIK